MNFTLLFPSVCFQTCFQIRLIQVEVGDIQHKNKLTPYLGRELRGVVYRFKLNLFWREYKNIICLRVHTKILRFCPTSIFRFRNVQQVFWLRKLFFSQHSGWRKRSILQNRRLQRLVEMKSIWQIKATLHCIDFFLKAVLVANSCFQKNPSFEALYKFCQNSNYNKFL